MAITHDRWTVQSGGVFRGEGLSSAGIFCLVKRTELTPSVLNCSVLRSTVLLLKTDKLTCARIEVRKFLIVQLAINCQKMPKF